MGSIARQRGMGKYNVLSSRGVGYNLAWYFTISLNPGNKFTGITFFSLTPPTIVIQDCRSHNVVHPFKSALERVPYTQNCTCPQEKQCRKTDPP